MTDEVEIRIDGIPYRTVIDEEGIQRFPTNVMYRHLVDTKQINLDRLNTDFQNGRFTLEEYTEFNIGLGYSVGGYMEIFREHIGNIENPLRDK